MPDLEVLNEEQLTNQTEREAERLYKKYREHMEVLESDSTLSTLRQVTPFDIYALGKQFEMFEAIERMHEANGTTAELGQIPAIAKDVLTVSYGTSIVPHVATTQPMNGPHDIVYYYDVKAVDARGNKSAGEAFMNPREGMAEVPTAYASDKIDTFDLGNTGSGTLVYGSLATTTVLPILPYSVVVTIPTLSLTAKDWNGDGNIYGVGIQGTIVYSTGVVTLALLDDPLGTEAINLAYRQDHEGADDIPELTMVLTSTDVKAQVYALKMKMGMLQEFELERRLGLMARDELAANLTAGINAEIGGVLVRLLAAAAQGNTVFTVYGDLSTPGYSEADYNVTFKSRLADAEGEMLSNAGRGTVTTLIAGRTAAAVISTIPGFLRVNSAVDQLGPHLFGTLDSIVVIRVPQSNILAANICLALYRGTSALVAPAVYGPYMPLLMTPMQKVGENPLMQQRAVAVWAAVKVLVQNFITKITFSS